MGGTVMEGDMPGAQSLPPPWSWRRGGWVPGEGWGPLGQVTGEQWSGRGLALNRGHPALFWKSCIDVFHSLSLSSGSNSLFYSTLKSLYSLFSFCFCLLLFSFVFNFLFVCFSGLNLKKVLQPGYSIYYLCL